MDSVSTCRHCEARIIRVNYAMGEKWVHQQAGASYLDGTYEFCRVTTAGPGNPRD